MTNRTIQFWGQGYSTPVGATEVSLTPCTITATFNGTQVFSGVIPTIESSDVNRQPSDQSMLFSFETDVPTGYTYPVVLEITGADTFFSDILVNYCGQPNPVYTTEQYNTLNTIGTPVDEKLAIWEPLANPPLSQADIDLLSTTDEAGYPARNACLAAHGLALQVTTGADGYLSAAFTGDCRSNVVVTGASYVSPPPPDTRNPGEEGTWGWEVEVAPGNTATMNYDLLITQPWFQE